MLQILFGGVIALLVFILILSTVAKSQFERQVEREIEDFFSGSMGELTRVSETELQDLPEPVQRWLRASGVVGSPVIRSVRIKQDIQMKLKPDGRWLEATADQYDRTEAPGFLWQAQIKAAPGIHISGRDLFTEGRGHMLIKPLSLFKAVDSRGQEIDEGSMQRYLGELVWVPTAAISPYITWEAEDATTAKATMSYGGVTVSGRFYFNAETGLVDSFRTLRFMVTEEGSELRPWEIPVSDYRQYGDYYLPSKAVVIWQLPEGPYDWFHVTVTDVEVNRPEKW